MILTDHLGLQCRLQLAESPKITGGEGLDRHAAPQRHHVLYLLTVHEGRVAEHITALQTALDRLEILLILFLLVPCLGGKVIPPFVDVLKLQLTYLVDLVLIGLQIDRLLILDKGVGARFIESIYRLVGELPVSDIALCQIDSRLKGFLRISHVMVLLVDRLELL